MSQGESPSILDFSRFELKYLIPLQWFGPLKRDLLNFTRAKLHNEAEGLDHYHVRSLYYDDMNYTCYHDKLAGVTDRRKLRIRTYSRNTAEKTPVFLEFKIKNNMTVRKARVELPGVNSSIFSNSLSIGDVFSISQLTVNRPELISSYFAHRQVFKFDPKVLIVYDRIPLEDTTRPDFRICIDHNIRACSTDNLFPDKGWVDVLWRWAVIEIKFTLGVPKWFQYIIGKYNLYNEPVSKYCNACEALGVAIHESKEILDHGYNVTV